MSGRPMPHSSIGRVRAYFERNPDEELAASDMRIKFRIDKKQTDRIVHVLRGVGFLAADHSVQPVVYRRVAA